MCQEGQEDENQEEEEVRTFFGGKIFPGRFQIPNFSCSLKMFQHIYLYFFQMSDFDSAHFVCTDAIILLLQVDSFTEDDVLEVVPATKILSVMAWIPNCWEETSWQCWRQTVRYFVYTPHHPVNFPKVFYKYAWHWLSCIIELPLSTSTLTWLLTRKALQKSLLIIFQHVSRRNSQVLAVPTWDD